MSLLAMSEGFEGLDVGVYAGDVLVGCGVIESGMTGIAVWGDDPMTTAIDGAMEGEALTLRLRDDLGEHDVVAELIQGELTYRTDGLAIVSLKGVSSPVEFGLTMAYPNPFNSVMNLEFALQRGDAARVTLHDLTGREVLRLYEGRLPSGNHRLALNGDDLASGIYLLQLESGGEISQMKVALVR